MNFFSLRKAASVMIKEFIQLKRDKITLRMIVMIPIMQLILFGYALNTDPKHLPTAVISQDNSEISRAIIEGLRNTDYFSIDYNIDSDQKGNELLKRGDVLFVVSIPANFERDLIRGEHPKILIEADASDPVASSGALSAANGMLDRIMGQELTGSLANLSSASSAFSIRFHKLYNPEGFTRYNIIPGLVAIILTMTGIMMTSLAMTRETERGTMENLLAMPISPLEVMAGKITPYVIIGFFQAALIIFSAKVLFDVPIIGSLWLLFGVLVIFITCNMALGFTISAVAQNQTQALQLSIVVLLPSILLSGFMFPFLGMPLWAQYIGNTIPATHFIAISRAIILKGSSFAEILPHIWPMLIFMVLIILITMKLYKKTLD